VFSTISAGINYATKECYSASDAEIGIGSGMLGGVPGRNLGLGVAICLGRNGTAAIPTANRSKKAHATSGALIASVVSNIVKLGAQ